MATFHCHVRSGKACKSAGTRHLDYIMGDGKYADKKDVVYCEDGNLPNFANCGKDLFSLADKNERSNGRSFRGLTIAIPNEAGDPVAWSRNLVHAIVDGQAYSFAVHLKNNNPHLHLMFSERTNNRTLQPEKYFSRVNKKIRAYTEKTWLKKTKQKYLGHIRLVAPDYVPAMTGGKEKQFSPSQPEQIAGVQSERIYPRLLAQEKALHQEILQHTNQGELKMNHNKLLNASTHASVDEGLGNIYGEMSGMVGVVENADDDPLQSKYQYRLARQIYEGFSVYGLTYCHMRNPNYVYMCFADKSKIYDHGDRLVAHAGTVEDNAQRIIELARIKKWKSVRLMGSMAFVEMAMRNAHAAGLDVSPIDSEQLELWNRILQMKPHPLLSRLFLMLCLFLHRWLALVQSSQNVMPVLIRQNVDGV